MVLNKYLNELLPATLMSAFERSLTGVYSHVPEQITASREPLSTLFALMRLFLAI
jgi:hypothetical protein